jgi:hypothetical protein
MIIGIAILVAIIGIFIATSFTNAASSTTMAGYAAISKAQWGTYRPNVYLGAKARVAHSPIIGVLWYDSDDVSALQRIRHDAEERDKLSKWGWTHHDGSNFGVQELIDPLVGVNFTSHFIRTGEQSGSFVLRMYGTPTTVAKPKKNAQPRNISLLWYAAMENPAHVTTIVDQPSAKKRGIDGAVEVRVETGGTSSQVAARLPSFTIRAPVFATNTHTRVLKSSSRARTAAKEESLDKVRFPLLVTIAYTSLCCLSF